MLPDRLDEGLGTILEDVNAWSLPEKVSQCEKALEFSDWIDLNLSDEVLGKDLTQLTISLAKAKLTDRYRFFRRQVPKSCRNHARDRGHVCIFHVWDKAYARLEEIEGRLPEPLTVPELQELKKLRERDDERPFATLVALQEEG